MCSVSLVVLTPPWKVEGGERAIDVILQRALRRAGDTDDRFAEKRWFGEWKWVSSFIARGNVFCAKGGTYKITLEFDLKKPGEGFRLIDSKITKPEKL